MANNISSKTSKAITTLNLSKAYRIWSDPAARLKGPVLDSLSRIFPESSMLRQRAAKKSSQYYHDFFALNDVSFEIEKGESVGIIGRNGSGKSTLLKILAGILKPTSGRGVVEGETAALLELGSGFNPEFTGRENIYLNGALWGLSEKEIDGRLKRILDFADIGEFIDQSVRIYSDGMFVRLAFAVAISVDPDVLIVDEALAVGDVFFQQKCFRYMREELRHTTRILVTHNMQAVTSLCSRVLILSEGRLVFDGPPIDGVAHYMKDVHNAQRNTPTRRAPLVDESPAPTAESELAWTQLADSQLGGLGHARISATAITINGEGNAGVIKAGDRIDVFIKTCCMQPMARLIFGYLVRDRRGSEIFAENSLGFTKQPITLGAGESLFRLAFDWPHIRPGPYFLTVGIGQGEDAYDHDVQCWAHNVAKLEAIQAGPPILAIFNNPLTAFERLEMRQA